ncbi:MAG: hypothetical protein HY255_02640, partial [Betaproteobacteria bacterium]|nr:hypothetical protein [Betaproteobacteria bacterium]
KRYWDIHPFLSKATAAIKIQPSGIYAETHTPLRQHLAGQFERCGYNFVPLVRAELSLVCSIEILFLRPDVPGTIIKSGDLDNRLKTLFDALRLPVNQQELGGYLTPQQGETPFYCLLEDDGLITHISVTTDTLLQPVGADIKDNDARLVITVKIKPHLFTYANSDFG